MRLLHGTAGISNGLCTPPMFAAQREGSYTDTYTMTAERKSGCTYLYTRAFDMSRYRNGERQCSIYTHIRGDTKTEGSGNSVWMTYEIATHESGATWVSASTKLRTSGTSVSGTSGSAFTAITSPVIAPFWRLAFVCTRAARTTGDMEVDYVLAVE